MDLYLTTPREIADYLRPRMNFSQEEFWAIALTSHLRLLKAQCLFRGSVDECPYHPRDIFRFAILHNAANLAVAHNHPSGDPLGSEADLDVTRHLIWASKLMRIRLIDHIIVTQSTYNSLINPLSPNTASV